MAKVKITETGLRDGHQSLIATRMTTDEMLPILETMDQVGYHALEMWGGATFDACLRFLNEDPWERLRVIRKNIKNTKLQMLLRGQNLLGYKHYADDVVEEFVKKALANGIDIIRVFDALNDPRNLRKAIETVKKEGGIAQAAMSYTISPVHTNEVFTNLALEFQDMGADSICIKDMAGLLDPYNTYTLVKEMKKKVKIPIEIHTHATSGLGSMTLLKAVEAGADIIDTAISPFGEGTSQPSTEPMVAALSGTEWDTGLDMDKLNEVAEYFRPIREKYIEEGLLDPKLMGVDINTLKYQVPGGMLSNLVSQLKQQNAMDKFEEVLKEISTDYKIYAASNGVLTMQENRLQLSELKKYFTDLYVSDDIGYAKPNINFFTESMDRAKLRPSEILMVGDSLVSDIAGAREADIDSVWYNPYGLENLS